MMTAVSERCLEVARKITVDDFGIDVPGRMQESYIAILSGALANAKREGMKEAAEIADAYADENIQMASDTIMIDPVLSGKRGQKFTDEEWERAEKLKIEGCIHSSMFHAAQNIRDAILAEAERI